MPSRKYAGNKKKQVRPPVANETSVIYWCVHCNVPLLEKKCGVCSDDIFEIKLSGPGDIRFCSPYERKLLKDLFVSDLGCDPLGERLVLLNKISGDDKTAQVIVDGLDIGTLLFDMTLMKYRFEISVAGAQIFHEYTTKRTVVLKRTKMHLNGKKVNSELLESFTSDIKSGDPVIVRSGNLVGVAISLVDSNEMGSTDAPVLRIRKISATNLKLNPKISGIENVITSNLPHLRKIGKNAMNTIKGIANQKEHRKLPIHVSFSGGKDSLVVLDLALSALKGRDVKAFFLNTGIEFPETVDFVHSHCENRGIELIESKAETAFWENVESFGPPAKDFRWCCKVCKLAPAGIIIDQCSKDGNVCLTIDGKRKFESFARSNISASEKNPFVPNQLNIFPIRDWRAIEVWLYIYWRKLDYNPLYDSGFERVGCYLCPAELSAEYERLKDIHPSIYDRWNSYLQKWARSQGLSDAYVKHGMWRWKELPPKMLKLANELGIDIEPSITSDDFDITLTSGFSPCKDGGFTVEAAVRGVLVNEALAIMNILGSTVFSEDLGMVLLKMDNSTVKLFSSGSLKITARSKEDAYSCLEATAKQLLRESKCTECGICLKVCPVNAIELSSEKGKIYITDSCIRCGKCIDGCVVLKYSDKLLSDLLNKKA